MPEDKFLCANSVHADIRAKAKLEIIAKVKEFLCNGQFGQKFGALRTNEDEIESRVVGKILKYLKTLD